MKKLFLLLFFTSFSANAEYKVNINLSKYGKEAIKFVENKLKDTPTQLILNEIDIEYTNKSGNIAYKLAELNLNNSTYFVFSIIDINSKKQIDGCNQYDRHIAKLKVNKLSGFSYVLGKYEDCTSKKGNLNDLLK